MWTAFLTQIESFIAAHTQKIISIILTFCLIQIKWLLTVKLKTIKSKCEFFLGDKFIPTQCYSCMWWYISFLLHSADKKFTRRRRKIFKTDNIQHSWGVYEVANFVSENAKENKSAHVTLVFMITTKTVHSLL